MTALPHPWLVLVGVLLLALLLLAVVLVALALHRLRRPDLDARMREQMARDAADPFKRWVQASFGVVCPACDYAYLPRLEAHRILRDWWDVHGPTDHAKALRELATADRPDNAWDLVRFMVVSRLGVGADYLTPDESWHCIRPVACRLQAAYSGWKSMAQAYLLARRQWRGFVLDGSEDDDDMRRIIDNIVVLGDNLWMQVEFDLDLSTTEERP